MAESLVSAPNLPYVSGLQLKYASHADHRRRAYRHNEPGLAFQAATAAESGAGPAAIGTTSSPPRDLCDDPAIRAVAAQRPSGAISVASTFRAHERIGLWKALRPSRNTSIDADSRPPRGCQVQSPWI
jgi:hypothetical protein